MYRNKSRAFKETDHAEPVALELRVKGRYSGEVIHDRSMSKSSPYSGTNHAQSKRECFLGRFDCPIRQTDRNDMMPACGRYMSFVKSNPPVKKVHSSPWTGTSLDER